jgi:general secretion pathway protein E
MIGTLRVRPLSEDTRRQRVLDRLTKALGLDPAVVERARLLAARTGHPLEQVLNQMGVVPDDHLARAYADVCECQVWDPDEEPAQPIDASITQSGFLEAQRLLPLGVTDRLLTVAAYDPLNDEGLAGLAFASGRTVEVRAALPADFRRAAHELFGEVEAPGSGADLRLEAEAQRVIDVDSDSEAARRLSAILEAAVARRASDIHIEPRRHDAAVRLRVDGRLSEVLKTSPEAAASLVSRVKVLSNLNLGERRLPQDGRATFVVEGRSVEARVSLVPTVFGESAVLRILDRVGVEFDLEALGVMSGDAMLLRRAAHANHGMFLLAGPTGSGKTTTLYALLNILAGADKKILSIEDPVEHHFAHVNQIQVAPQIGLTFAHALRAFLRQDPDVILVGEIRDPETAAVAIQAAMTGHLVLASIHANDAVRVIPRLQDMGIEPYQLAASLLGCAAQRLVRRLCPTCRTERAPTEPERMFAHAVGAPPAQHAWSAKGCSACGGGGFRGRIALLETFLCDEAVANAVAHGEPAARLRERAQASGLRDMALDGVEKATAGLTTFAEVMSALQA